VADVTWRLACARVCVDSSVTMCERVCVEERDHTKALALNLRRKSVCFGELAATRCRCHITADPAGAGVSSGAASSYCHFFRIMRPPTIFCSGVPRSVSMPPGRKPSRLREATTPHLHQEQLYVCLLSGVGPVGASPFFGV
jgi:hypothetical protein